MNTNELIPKAEDKIVCVKVGKIKREHLVLLMSLLLLKERSRQYILQNSGFIQKIPNTLEDVSLLAN